MALGNVLPEFAPAHIAYGFGNDLGSLRNAGGRLAIRCSDTEIDAMEYTEASSGVAQILDGTNAPNHITNDDTNNLCESENEFSPGSFGSPGDPNGRCGNSTPGQCDDNGTMRAVSAPSVGDLVISEVMPDPSAVNDSQGEWFEIYAIEQVDLNGLVAGPDSSDATPPFVLDSQECIVAAAGTSHLFVKNADPLTNGGLPAVPIEQEFSFNVSNDPGTLFIGIGNVVLDEVAWSNSPTGASLSLDPAQLDPISNDDPGNFCDGVGPYGDGDEGTPGADNPSCGATGGDMCMGTSGLQPIANPGMDDLLITEFLFNTKNGNDSNGEWIEVKNVGSTAFDLNGLTVADAARSEPIAAAECLTVAPGGYGLLAKSAISGDNAGLPEVSAVFGFDLNNSGTETITFSLGIDTLDSVTYMGTTGDDGIAHQLDEATGKFCRAASPYGPLMENLGTPKADNDVLCP